MKALNLGCGNRFHPDWENVDFASINPIVKRHDISEKLPYPDCSFDVVYHSHLLEHFPKNKALGFLRECFRILTHKGLIRVAVPDLEQIARTYLEALEKASRGLAGWDRNYDWMVLELYDQAVREQSGGSYTEFLSQESPNLDFVARRLGVYADL